MIRITDLESRGAALAVMSDRSDGDQGLGVPAGSRHEFALTAGFAPDRLVCAQQVHGTRIRTVTAEDCGAGAFEKETALPETDGLVTNVAGVVLGVLVADCVPVFLYDPVRKAVGLVHAGREGTRNGIAAVAVRKMQDVYGCVPDEMFAVLGPSAGSCCYEVSDAIACQFAEMGYTCTGRRLDLWDANFQQLYNGGLPGNHVTITGICTICTDRFFSYRRQKDTRRNLAVISV